MYLHKHIKYHGGIFNSKKDLNVMFLITVELCSLRLISHLTSQWRQVCI